MTIDTHGDGDLIPILDEQGTWLVRGGLAAPVLAVVNNLRDALTRAYQEETKATRSVLVIVRTPVDDVTIHRGQMARMWGHLGLAIG